MAGIAPLYQKGLYDPDNLIILLFSRLKTKEI